MRTIDEQLEDARELEAKFAGEERAIPAIGEGRIVPPHRSGGGYTHEQLEEIERRRHASNAELAPDAAAPNDPPVIDLTARIRERDRAALERDLNAELANAGVTEAKVLVGIDPAAPASESLIAELQGAIDDERVTVVDLDKLQDLVERPDAARYVLEGLHTPYSASTQRESAIAVVPAAALDALVDAQAKALATKNGLEDLEIAIGAMDPSARAFFETQLAAQMPPEVEAKWDVPGLRLGKLKTLLRMGRELQTRAFWIQCIEAIALDERDELRQRAERRTSAIAAAEAKRERRRQRNRRAMRGTP